MNKYTIDKEEEKIEEVAPQPYVPDAEEAEEPTVEEQSVIVENVVAIHDGVISRQQ